MPLSRARCSRCTEPLADAPYVPLPMTCVGCGRPCVLHFAADGQPAEFDAAFSPERMLRWMDAARRSMAAGNPGVALGACPHCQWPLVASTKARVSLPCPHCRGPVEGAAEDVLVDQWCEPWTRVEAGATSVEYRLAWVGDETGVTAGCARCGGPTSADDPSMQCQRCGATTWVPRRLPQDDDGGARIARQQLGVRADGTRAGRPVSGLASLAQGDMSLRSDLRAAGIAAGSGGRTMSVLGLGCAILFALSVLFVIGVWIVVTLKK